MGYCVAAPVFDLDFVVYVNFKINNHTYLVFIWLIPV